MGTHNHQAKRRFALLGGMLLILAACGGGESSNTLDPDTSAPASTTAGVDTTSGAGGDLSGASFVVGSKEFTEQLILGQITKQVLENAGATVEDQTGLVGSQVVREALVSGEIDMYWEYTGTGWITHLGNTTPVAGSEEQFVAVRDADASNGIVWLDPAPFNNTYAIALASEKATELGLTTVSDLATYAGENPAEATLCGAAEFLGRDDGLPGLEAAYGMTFANVSELELGLVYTSIDQGDPCVFGEVFATDGRIAALGLTVLEDDESFFPSYLPSLSVRQEVFEAYPQLADLFAPVAEALDTATMQRLNAMVDVDGLEPSDVATQFLTEMGLGGS